ncbi:MAG: substrate-binding domain-containing protein [Gammaproteobacteria bacterium]|nr:substrate-binding domain-containing protein [Gammaproteobacteria bacterium]
MIELGCSPSQILSLPVNWRKTPVEAGLDIGAAILSQRQRPSAVYAFNEMAAGLINYAWAHGIHVPRDLSVAGFEADGACRVAPITTCTSRSRDARGACSPSRRRQHAVVCRCVVVRESTAAAQ